MLQILGDRGPDASRIPVLKLLQGGRPLAPEQTLSEAGIEDDPQVPNRTILRHDICCWSPPKLSFVLSFFLSYLRKLGDWTVVSVTDSSLLGKWAMTGSRQRRKSATQTRQSTEERSLAFGRSWTI